MTTPDGWYPQSDGQPRYWDGELWTEHFDPGAALVATPANGTARPKVSAVGSAAALMLLLLLTVLAATSGVRGVLIMLGIAALVAGVVASVRGRLRLLRVTSRRAGVAGSCDAATVPTLLRRRSVLTWMTASMGLVSLNAAQPSAAVATTVTEAPTINAPTINALTHSEATNVFALPQIPRPVCGVYKSGATERVWAFSSSGLFQVDSFTIVNADWTAVTLPAAVTNASMVNLKIVVWTPPAGVPTMFFVARNNSTLLFEVYSAPVVAKGVSPTWTTRLTLSANADCIPTMMHTTSVGVFVGEYSLVPNIAGGPSVYRTTDGTTFTKVLGPLAVNRHIHGVYEDPFHPGTIYVTAGDNTNGDHVYRSTDGGNTFTGLPNMASYTWQAVAMGFTAEYVWGISDSVTGSGPYIFDRNELVPRWATFLRHDRIAVPGAIGGRRVADGVFNSTTTITSATAAFTTADKGRFVEGNAKVPIPAYIVTVTNVTTVVLSVATTGSAGTAQTFVICGDRFYSTAYSGAVDPATGFVYIVANDNSVGGNVAGIFVITGPDRVPHLLHTLFLPAFNRYETFIEAGQLFVGQYGPLRLLA